MADDEPLKPEDFSVQTSQKQIVENDGKTIAEARRACRKSNPEILMMRSAQHWPADKRPAFSAARQHDFIPLNAACAWPARRTA
jgi:hypothetical protein